MISSAGSTGTELPPTITAFSFSPSAMPPSQSLKNSRKGRPRGIS